MITLTLTIILSCVAVHLHLHVTKLFSISRVQSDFRGDPLYRSQSDSHALFIFTLCLTLPHCDYFHFHSVYRALFVCQNSSAVF
jgi:hypothetical protein